MNKDWLDIGVLEDYLDGKLDAKTMNRVEREALDDPFVAEALAGLSESPKRSLQSMSLLQKQLHERIAEHHSIKKESVITWQRLSIAATAAVMFVAISIMFWLRENNYQKELAGRTKKIEVTIAPATPVVEPPAAVQAAPVIASESADQVREKEIDKAVKAAKTNSYAARRNKKTDIAISQAVPQASPSITPQQLNDIVVVGYGAQQKKNITGAAVQYKRLSLTAVTDSNKWASDDSALNEVMVVGYATAKKESYSDTVKINGALAGRVAGVQIRGMSTAKSKPAMVSNPIGGWDKLWIYMEENNAFKNEEKIGQTVELDFKIANDGTPTDIRILKEADHKYEEEAVRLIINGPKWESPLKAKSRMTFKIDF